MRRIGRAISDHSLIAPRDRVLVAVSGGPSSYALLHLLEFNRRRFPFVFSIQAAFFNPGWDQASCDLIQDELRSKGFDIEIIEKDIRTKISQAVEQGKSACSLCCKYRQRALMTYATSRGYNKIALGDRAEDFIEGLFKMLLFSGRLGTMPIKTSTYERGCQLIRPLAYVEDSMISEFSVEQDYRPIESLCPYRLTEKRQTHQHIRNLLELLEKSYPRVKRSLMAAMKNIRSKHLLDQKLHK
jgi:tRNA 2-thiocytidine biosynthesis protein TtcA